MLQNELLDSRSSLERHQKGTTTSLLFRPHCRSPGLLTWPSGRSSWSSSQTRNGCSTSSIRSSGSRQVFFKAKGWYCRVRTSLGFYGNRRQGKTASTSRRPPPASAASHIFQPQKRTHFYLPFLFVSTLPGGFSLKMLLIFRNHSILWGTGKHSYVQMRE